MKISLFLSLLLFITLIHPASYKDNQTDIYVKEYTGDIIKSGDYSYQATRLVIGVKVGVTKDEVAEIAKSVGGEIAGWSLVPSLYDSYSIDLPKDKLDLSMYVIKNNPKVVYVIRNYVDETVVKTYYSAPVNNESFVSPYYGEVIIDNQLVGNRTNHNYFQANTILLGVKEGITENEIEKLSIPYGGKVTGHFRIDNSFVIFLPADQRELAIKELVKNPEIESADRDYYVEALSSDSNSGSTLCLGIGLLILLTISVIIFIIYKKFKK